MKTVHAKIKIKLMPVSTEKTITVSNLTQDELDFRD
jgi:hypothetical protein